MVFSSTTFLFFFFPLLVIAYYFPYLKKSIAYRNGILLMASLLFYAWGEPLFVLVLIISILTNWILGNGIGKYRKSNGGKVLLGIAVIYNLGLLVVFKYLNFITDNISKVFNNPGIVTQIALPIGISFFTFQILSYIFDIYYGKTCAQKSIWKLALYIMLFPQMVAGPIVRYEQIEQELDKRISSQKDVLEGMKRFIYGLSKKVLLADRIGQLADICFSRNTQTSVCLAWLGGKRLILG